MVYKLYVRLILGYKSLGVSHRERLCSIDTIFVNGKSKTGLCILQIFLDKYSLIFLEREIQSWLKEKLKIIISTSTSCVKTEKSRTFRTWPH